jgi:hypothetical protein
VARLGLFDSIHRQGADGIREVGTGCHVVVSLEEKIFFAVRSGQGTLIMSEPPRQSNTPKWRKTAVWSGLGGDFPCVAREARCISRKIKMFL